MANKPASVKITGIVVVLYPSGSSTTQTARAFRFGISASLFDKPVISQDKIDPKPLSSVGLNKIPSWKRLHKTYFTTSKSCPTKLRTIPTASIRTINHVHQSGTTYRTPENGVRAAEIHRGTQ